MSRGRERERGWERERSPIAKLSDEQRKEENVCVCVCVGRHGLSAFSSYFVAGCSIVRAYNDTIVSPDNASESVSHYFWPPSPPRRTQSKRPPFRSRNEPSEPRLFISLFFLFRPFSPFSANSIFRYRIIDSNL